MIKIKIPNTESNAFLCNKTVFSVNLLFDVQYKMFKYLKVIIKLYICILYIKVLLRNL